MKVNNREVPQAANSIPEGVRQRIEEQGKIKDTKDAQGQPVLSQIIEINRQLKIAQAEGLQSRAAANREAVFGLHPTGVVKGWEGTAIQPLETTVRSDDGPTDEVIQKLQQESAAEAKRLAADEEPSLEIIERLRKEQEARASKSEPVPSTVAIMKIFANAKEARTRDDEKDPNNRLRGLEESTFSPSLNRSPRSRRRQQHKR